MSSGLTKAQRHMLSTPARDSQGHLIAGSLSNAGLTNRTAEALRRMGMIEWRPGHHFGGQWSITPAGRQALKELITTTEETK